MKIAFQIQGAPDFSDLSFLCSILQKFNDLVLLNIDAKVNLTEHSQTINSLNVMHMPQRHKITWGGYSQVESFLSGIKHALASEGSWEYIANMSPRDMITQPLGRLKAFLTDQATQGTRNFVFCYVPKLDPVFPNEASEETSDTPIFWREDVKICVQPVLKPMFDDWKISPLGISALRPGLFMDEDGDAVTLRFRTLLNEERDHRKHFFAINQYRSGTQWLLLHRSMCEWIIESTLAKELTKIMRNVFVSDEAFFQMLCFHPDNPFRHQTVSRSLYITNGNARDISDASITELQATQACFFARKVSWNSSPSLRQWVSSFS